ncbi:hypothetical protein B0A67_09575 [Flavobacterium aquidurense]|nr:hypothetical protein B0A67_09575 [Flavobacterium aquidurense]
METLSKFFDVKHCHWIAGWHADDTDSLNRKRGFTRIFFVALFFLVKTNALALIEVGNPFVSAAADTKD